MNDRLKFRARIYSTINRNEEDEKEISFYIYDVAVYADGGIGFCHDQLVDALNKLDLTDKQKEEIEEEISDNSYCEDYEWYSIEFGQVEQYTGIRDKNNRPIYERDIISNVKYIHEIVWDDKTASFRTKLKGMETVCGLLEQQWIDEFGFEAIGNIHDNKELLDD